MIIFPTHFNFFQRTLNVFFSGDLVISNSRFYWVSQCCTECVLLSFLDKANLFGASEFLGSLAGVVSFGIPREVLVLLPAPNS